MTLTEKRNELSEEYHASITRGCKYCFIGYGDGFDDAINLSLPAKFAQWLRMNDYVGTFRGYEKDGRVYDEDELWLFFANDEGLLDVVPSSPKASK